MALSPQTKHRLPIIKEGLLTGLNYTQIAEKLHVGHRTIDRDVKHFLESGEFETWLKEEWYRLHNIILHEDPTEAYRNITKLVSNMLTRKMAVTSEHTERLINVQISAKLLSNETCSNNQESPSQSNTNHTLNKKNFIKADTTIATEQPSQA